jgi:membrane protease YdiL (CAAX protease family)
MRNNVITNTDEKRLQRSMSTNGSYVNSFAQILSRHGLVMGVFLLLLTCVANSVGDMTWQLTAFTTSPFNYVAAAFGILLSFIFFLRVKGYRFDFRQGYWITYLFLISVIEEIAFRLILPSLLASFLGILAAIIVSNVFFASIHFFTLRWKSTNCIFVFLGGLGLSRLLGNTGDIAIVILVHWFFTFLNTPTSPNRTGQAAINE